MKKTPSCRYHCAACSRHFASERAFDAHRVGDHALPRDHPEGRRCSAPFEDEQFASEIGKCDVYEAQEGIEIYHLTQQRESIRNHFAGSAA